MRTLRRAPGKLEILINASIIIFALAAFFAAGALRTPGRYCEISVIGGGSVLVSLEEARCFSVFGMDNVVFEVRDGGIAFIESDCPDKICVRSGFLKYEGESAACLPNKLIMKIVGGSVEVDTFTK